MTTPPLHPYGEHPCLNVLAQLPIVALLRGRALQINSTYSSSSSSSSSNSFSYQLQQLQQLSRLITNMDNGLDESYTEILLGLRKENDPEAAIIFSLRWQGWEICNDQELLLEEIAAFRRTMSLGEAARRATGQCP